MQQKELAQSVCLASTTFQQGKKALLCVSGEYGILGWDVKMECAQKLALSLPLPAWSGGQWPTRSWDVEPWRPHGLTSPMSPLPVGEAMTALVTGTV